MSLKQNKIFLNLQQTFGARVVVKALVVGIVVGTVVEVGKVVAKIFQNIKFKGSILII